MFPSPTELRLIWNTDKQKSWLQFELTMTRQSRTKHQEKLGLRTRGETERYNVRHQ